MYCAYKDREEFEDDLYREDEGDSDGSEANSELEFHLYSQLHYSGNAADMEDQVDRGEEADGQDSLLRELTEKAADFDGEQEHTEQSQPLLPDISQIQQHLKKKRNKLDGQKKGKNITKGPSLSSFLFEEVIVIDSSPEVISISDTADDADDGVCALKGQGLQRLQTSTPAPQGTQKRTRNIRAPVTLDSSSSESDSGESESKSSSDSSDSEYLENWMILGRGNQDGDQSISLNLEGESDNIADVEEREGTWLVSDKDKEARIFNQDKGAKMTVQRVSNRYYTSKSVQCRNCDKFGHLSKNCPEPKKLSSCFLCGTPGHLVSQCPNRYCNNCGQPGHTFESCSERPYWHKQCHRCSMVGHFFDTCPEIWRQYHVTTKAGTPLRQHGEHQGRTPAYCYNCSKEGHFGFECTRQRMFNGTYPTTPFINHYDTKEDINRRKHRIKLRANELKKSGFIADGSEIPLTPGPPKKMQKLSHHQNNHPSKHKSHQNPSNPKPSPSHIFFKDKCDFRAPTPKKNKYKQHEGPSNVKPWKPKRPVPNTREPRSKIILDEADDFPRGGGRGEFSNRKKVRKAMLGKGRRESWTGEFQKSESKPEKGKKKKNRAWRTANKTLVEEMYPKDENLFIIKQRKRRR